MTHFTVITQALFPNTPYLKCSCDNYRQCTEPTQYPERSVISMKFTETMHNCIYIHLHPAPPPSNLISPPPCQVHTLALTFSGCPSKGPSPSGPPTRVDHGPQELPSTQPQPAAPAALHRGTHGRQQHTQSHPWKQEGSHLFFFRAVQKKATF